MINDQHLNLFDLFKQAALSKNIVEARGLSLAIKSNFNNEADFWYLSGLVDYWDNKIEDAISNLIEVRDLDNKHYEGMNLLALIYFQRNEYDKAIACLLVLNDSDSLYKKGVCYYSIGEFGAAIVALDSVKNNFDVRLMLGKSYKEVGLYSQAEILLKSIISEKSDNCHFATMWLGEILIKQNRLTELVEIFLPLLEHPHTNIAARSTLSEVYQIMGDLINSVLLLPQEIKTNWGHAFSMQVNARLKIRIASEALIQINRRDHPYPESNIGVSCITLKSAGRFAHSMFDYLALRYYADKFGLPVETPDWPGHYLFELDDPLISAPRKSVNRTGKWLEQKVDNEGILALIGCDFFSIGGLFDKMSHSHVLKAREVFKFRKFWLDLLTPLQEKLRNNGRTVISIHIRMTDMANMNIPIDHYINLLESIIPKIEKPVLFLASDDIENILPIFKKYNPISLADITDPWECLEWLQDFFILMNSDIVISSAGGFCRLANMLNINAKEFYRPDYENKNLIKYDPLINP